MIVLKFLTEEQNEKLNTKIHIFEKRIQTLEIDNDELNNENKKLVDNKNRQDFIQGLSDIYREYNNFIKEMLKSCVYSLPKNLRLDLNSIIIAYNDHNEFIDKKDVQNYIQEFREFILPNINKWYYEYSGGKWNWDFFIWMYELNDSRNNGSHIFYKEKKKNKKLYKEKLTHIYNQFTNEKLINTIDDFKTFEPYLTEFIEYELSI